MYEKEKTICLSELDDLKEFVKAATECDFDIDVYYNRAVIDAKSFLGMIGIGFKKNVTVCYGGNSEAFDNVLAKYAPANA